MKMHSRPSAVYYILLSPALAMFTFAVVVPFLMGINVSLTNWDGLSQTMDHIGFRNFSLFLRSDHFWSSVKNSLYFALLITIGNNLLSLALSLALHQPFRGRGWARSAFFLPTCLSTVLVAFIWNFLFRDVFSQLFGVRSMLGNMNTVIPGIVIIAMWNGLGINIVIYLAGLASIPRELYEAAIVDGAGQWQKLIKITLPMLMPSLTICVTMTLISGLKEFATTMAATGGGPGHSSEMISIYIYKNLYSFYQAGYGQAVAIAFVLILALCGSLLTMLFRRKEVEA